MSLSDEIAKKRAAEGWAPNPYYSSKDRVTSLRIEDSGGEIWMLPWHHFTFGHYREAGERERLVHTFVAHEVTMRGLNLTELIPEIVNQSIEWLRALPEKYVKSAKNEASIDQIQVRSLAEPVVTEKSSKCPEKSAICSGANPAICGLNDDSECLMSVETKVPIEIDGATLPPHLVENFEKAERNIRET